MSEEKMIAITGITGHTGRLFLKVLESHSFKGKLRCLVRSSSNTEVLDKSSLNIDKIIGSNDDMNSLLRLTEVCEGKRIDVLLHIYNIRHSLNILKAAKINHIPRVVLIHTTGVYSKYKIASGEYKEIENKIDEFLKTTTEMDVTILRPTMIFGDMCDHNIHKFIKMVDKLPIMPEINHGSGRIQPVNARDLANAYYAVINANHLPQLRYDLSGERSVTLHELFDLIGNELGKKVYHLSFPMWFGCVVARFVKLASLGKLDYVEKVLRMGENRDYNHDAATKDFAYKPEPFDVGLTREIKEYKRIG